MNPGRYNEYNECYCLFIVASEKDWKLKSEEEGEVRQSAAVKGALYTAGSKPPDAVVGSG